MNETLIPGTDRAGWDAALEGIPHAFGHTWASCAALSETSGHDIHLYCLESEGRRVVCPLAERTWGDPVDVATPVGFSGPAGDLVHPGLWSRLAAFARERGWVCGYFGLHPLFASVAGDVDAPAHNSVYVLDLRSGLEALHCGLDRNRRRQIAGWDRGALVTDPGPLIDFLVREHEPFMRSVGASLATFLSAETIRRLCAAPGTLLLGAARAGAVEAACLFGATPWAADAVFSLARPEGRRHLVPLLWQAVRALHEQGVPALNLGGGVREGDRVAEAKARFGARQVPLRAVRQVYRPDVFQRLCAEAGVDPADPGYFPPYRWPVTP